MHTTEMRMLRRARGNTRLDHVRNVDIWKEAHMYLMTEFLREKRLIWFGHVQRRDKYDATRKILQITVGRPTLICRDLVEEDMARNQMTTEMAEYKKKLLHFAPLTHVDCNKQSVINTHYTCMYCVLFNT